MSIARAIAGAIGNAIAKRIADVSHVNVYVYKYFSPWSVVTGVTSQIQTLLSAPRETAAIGFGDQR